MSILTKASSRVAAAEAEYGTAERVYSKVADLWSAYLGDIRFTLSAQDVCMMMVLLKMGREMSKHKEDNLVDIAGYVELLGGMAY